MDFWIFYGYFELENFFRSRDVNIIVFNWREGCFHGYLKKNL
jgi:hypothetical protein